MAVATLLTGCRSFVRGLDADLRYHGYDHQDEWMPPSSLARMVEHSTIIVIARHESVADLGIFQIGTPEPFSLALGLPSYDVELAAGTVMVDAVLKGDGHVVAGDSITFSIHGRVPRGTAEHERDANGELPLVWPSGTEFILFLDGYRAYADDAQMPRYKLQDRCNRVLTSGWTVTCSDGHRTRLKFMDWVNRDRFIAAIETEVAHPSDTATPYPSMTPEPLFVSDRLIGRITTDRSRRQHIARSS